MDSNNPLVRTACIKCLLVRADPVSSRGKQGAQNGSIEKADLGLDGL